jgi:cobalt-zinc-cadmium efflux system protein
VTRCCSHDHDHHEHEQQDNEHGHSHGLLHAHDHSQELRSASRRRLWWALGINLAFLIAEVIGGIMSGSLALLADAGHMLTDVAALGLAIFVSVLASRPPTAKRTFGLLRAEVVGAFLNGATLVLICGYIFWESAVRMAEPQPVQGPLMLGVAFLGLLANLGSAAILYSHRHENVNLDGAYLHMAADALGSVAAIIAGVVIWTTGWTPIDPLVSALIGAIILWGSLGLLRRTTRILLNSVPDDLNYERIKKSMEDNPHVESVQDLHIWNVTSGVPILTAHVRLAPECCETRHWHECLKEMQRMLREEHGIEHSTLQFEPSGYERSERWCDEVGQG